MEAQPDSEPYHGLRTICVERKIDATKINFIDIGLESPEIHKRVLAEKRYASISHHKRRHPLLGRLPDIGFKKGHHIMYQ